MAASHLKAAASSPRFGVQLTIASFVLLFLFYYGYTTESGQRGREISALDHLYHIFFISTNILLTAHYYIIATKKWQRVLLQYYILFRVLVILYRVAAWSFNLVLVFNTPVYLAMLFITVVATRTSKLNGRENGTNYRAAYQIRYMVQRLLFRLGKIHRKHDKHSETKHRNRRAHRTPQNQETH
jgi:hypothetical protein